MIEDERSSRRYSEKEVGLILRRATELQRSEPSAPDPTGLTLADLQDVASEVGIDPAYLRRAAAELEAGTGSGAWERLLGAPLAFVIERTVPGEFPESGFAELVPLMQAATVGQGNASAVGRTLTWSSRSDTNTSSQQVLVTVRDGETLIRIEERLAGFAGGLFGGLLGGGGGPVGIGLGGALGGALFGSAALAIAFPATIISASYLAARGFFAAHVRKRRARMQDLMDQLVEQVGRDVAERSLSPSPPSSP
jgi:hypothetical protein